MQRKEGKQNMIEQLVQKLFDAAIRNDKECFDSLFEQVFLCAKKESGLACPRAITRLFGLWTGHMKNNMIHTVPVSEIREHIGTHNFGTNYAIMTEGCGKFDSFIVEKYNSMDKCTESYKITR